MSYAMRLLAVFSVLLATNSVSSIELSQEFVRKLQSDPDQIDRDYPPQMVGMVFEIDGARLNAIYYSANGKGPHPTAVLLHGYPGHERNLDVAQALRRVGWNVLFFHYRGSWGSEGTFTFGNVMEDAMGAVNYLRQPDVAAKHRIDPERISLVGHSMGGFAAYYTGSIDNNIQCTTAIASPDFGALGRAIKEDDGVRDMISQLITPPFVLKSVSSKELVDDLAKNSAEYDMNLRAKDYKDRPILIITGKRDNIVNEKDAAAIVSGLTKAKAKVTHVSLDDAHSFSASRIALSQTIAGWMDKHCGSKQ